MTMGLILRRNLLVFSLLLATVPLLAQPLTLGQLYQTIDQTFPDNAAGKIRAADLRARFKDIALMLDRRGTPDAQPMSINQVRALSSVTIPAPPRAVLVTDDGQQGIFLLDMMDSTTPDNIGTVLVSQAGWRYKRQFDGDVNARWFGARGQGVTAFDESIPIQAAINLAKQIFLKNGGNVRQNVLVPPGVYRLLSPLNMTNMTGVWLTGGRSRYVTTQLNGNTGGLIVDMTGTISCGLSGIMLFADKNDSNPSTVAVQFALSQGSDGNQLGGLNNGIENVFIQMDDMPLANGGLGAIGLLNIRGEEFAGKDLIIKANSPFVFSAGKDLSQTGISYTASSPYATVMPGTGSMGNCNFTGQMSLFAVAGRRPAIQLVNTNSFTYDGYLTKLGNAGGKETAIGLYGANDNIRVHGTIEQFSQIAALGSIATNLDMRIVTANQTNPATAVFDATGCSLDDSDLQVRFTIAGEYNNGRRFLYHAPAGGGDSPATGAVRNSTFSCAGWIDNATFISPNLLARSQNSRFNTGQPFEKVNGSLVDRKLYRVPIGTIASNHADIGGSVLRFSKADRATTSSGNAGSYKARVRGTITAGSYASATLASMEIDATAIITQNGNSSLNPVSTSGLILAKSVGNAAILDLTNVYVYLDLSGANGQVFMIVSNAGTSAGDPVVFTGSVELSSDFAVNQSIIFN